MGGAKREYKDSTFRSFFLEPENFAPLAGKVTGRKISPDDLRENTLVSFIWNNIRNDASFTVNDELIAFFEQQSTPNRNMPLRMLMYLTEMYNKDLTASDKKRLIYRDKIVPLLAPRFFMFYNGTKPYPERCVLKLSDAFSVKSDIELTVNVYNINYDENYSLLHACKPIHDYSLFVHMVRQNHATGMSRDEAVKKAMMECIERDVMRDYLEKHMWEVVKMFDLEWNEEDAHAAWLEEGEERGEARGMALGLKRGEARGMERGMIDGITASIRSLMKTLNLTLQQAMDALQIPAEEREKYEALV